MPIKITIDTNMLSADDILLICEKHGIDCRPVTVSGREVENTSWNKKIGQFTQISETMVWDESPWGKNSRWGTDSSGDDLEAILQIISNGSFPSSRQNLSDGERRQLRDAMIFFAHIREGRDVLVSNDARAFIRHGKRGRLEERFHTKIMTGEEFILWVKG